MKESQLKIAIVGAGFAGLSLAWHLLSSSKVDCTVFDREGVGKGASGIASGLLHPFPAAASHYSFMGKEALHQSCLLLKIAEKYSLEKIADYSGILKLALENNEKKTYSALSRKHEGLKWLLPQTIQQPPVAIKPCSALLIEQGITVFCEDYLQALWRACEEKGGKLRIKTIDRLSALEEFDIKIVCHGAAMQQFDPTWKLQFVKGQILTCKAPYPITQRSIIAKGYIAITKDPLIYHIGSTYEHHYKDPSPVMEVAKKLIFDQASSYIKCINDLEVIQCRAGIRVANSKTHLPVVQKYSRGLYAMTAFGSRGLLYHGLLGKQLAESIFYEDDTRISREFFLSQDYT